MKIAAKVLYILDGVSTLIAAILLLIFGICGTSGVLPTSEILIEIQKQFPEFTLEWVNNFFIAFIIIGGVTVLLSALSFLGAFLTREDKKYMGYHIFMIVISVIFGFDIVSMLGGIFALVANNDDN